MSRLLLLLLFALPGVAPAADPPPLHAARDRQRMVRAFEVTLGLTTHRKTLDSPDHTVTANGTGSAKLTTEGEKFRTSVNVPVFDPKRNGFTTRREERAFDGIRLFVRTHDPDECHIYENRPPAEWGDPFLPLEWTYRGTHTILSPVDGTGGPFTGVEIKPTGVEVPIGGRRCVEVVRIFGHGERESLLFDADRGYLPRKVRGVTIESQQHPRFGWTPSGWTSATGEVVTTVTVDSLDWMRMIPIDVFTLAFPPGSRVSRHSERGVEELVVAEDGSLVSESGPPPAARPAPPSLALTLAVVAGAVALFVGLVLLARRFSRESSARPSR